MEGVKNVMYELREHLVGKIEIFYYYYSSFFSRGSVLLHTAQQLILIHFKLNFPTYFNKTSSSFFQSSSPCMCAVPIGIVEVVFRWASSIEYEHKYE